MTPIQMIQKMLAPLHRRISLMITRTVVTMINDNGGLQVVQAQLLEGETAEIERLQDYGFTSRPPKGSEGVAVFVGGNRDHGIMLRVDNRQYRLKLPNDADVAMYDKSGNKIVMTPSTGKIEINSVGVVNVLAAQDINLGAELLTALDGLVTRSCQCAYGPPAHPVGSAKVRASLT